MAAIDDLDREVRRLRKRANELENTPARRAESELAELIGNNDETPTQRRGFAACLKSKAALSARQLREAPSQLESTGLPGSRKPSGGPTVRFRATISAQLFREFEESDANRERKQRRLLNIKVRADRHMEEAF